MLNHPSQILKEKERVKAQIVDIQGEQVSLSLKALKEDPWQKIDGEYQNGQTIEGKVIKFSSAGAFIQVDNKGIHGLVHPQESDQQPIEQMLKIGQSYQFEILSLSPEAHKMSLKISL